MNNDELTRAGYVCVAGKYYSPGHPIAKAHRFALDTGAAPKLERSAGHGAVGSLQTEARLGHRVLVRVTSYRKRLLDEDNLAEKYHVDLLRYAGIIPSDAPGTAKIEVCQKKVGPKEPERVLLEVFDL